MCGTRTVFTGDRGYCSYNNMAHVIEKGQYFLFRIKDIHVKKGMTAGFGLPGLDTFDETVPVTITRSHSKKIGETPGMQRFVDKKTAFDYNGNVKATAMQAFLSFPLAAVRH